MPTKTQKQFVNRWLNDLRSGEFQQVTGTLRAFLPDSPEQEGGYCCLGVACTQKAGEWKASDDEFKFVFRSIQGKKGVHVIGCLGDYFGPLTGLEFHPNELVRWDDNDYNMPNPAWKKMIKRWPVMKVYNSFEDLLMGMNDNKKTFLQIARVIERRADEVFGKNWRDNL